MFPKEIVWHGREMWVLAFCGAERRIAHGSIRRYVFHDFMCCMCVDII